MCAVGLPVVVVQPESMLEVESGSSIVLTVEASGIGLAYSWLRTDGIPLTGILRIEGIDTNQMTIREAEVDDSGVYVCEISNAVGTVRSREVTISVSKSVTKPQFQFLPSYC